MISDQCQTCGSTSHSRSECKYCKITCNFCNRIGHLERVCRQKKERKYVAEHIQSYVQPKKSPPHSREVSLRVNNHVVAFELDTDVMSTIISEKHWSAIGSPRLDRSNLPSKSYRGTSVMTEGECKVKVEHGNQVFNLSVIVMHGMSPTLLGLDWIKRLRLDLYGIIHGSNFGQRSINKMYSQFQPPLILVKPQSVPNKEREHFSKLQAHAERKIQRKSQYYHPCFISPCDESFELESLSDDILNRTKEPIQVKLQRQPSLPYPR